MDWNIFLSFALGAIVTLIPIILNNRFQAQERDKDRQEQRREAIVQAKEKWTERDILKIMESIEKVMRLVSGAANVDTNLQPTDEQLSLINKEFLQTADTIAQLVYSFDDNNIHSGFRDFTSAINTFIEKLPEMLEADLDKRSNSKYWIAVKQSAGYFQWALREKMISIQNSP